MVLKYVLLFINIQSSFTVKNPRVRLVEIGHMTTLCVSMSIPHRLGAVIKSYNALQLLQLPITKIFVIDCSSTFNINRLIDIDCRRLLSIIGFIDCHRPEIRHLGHFSVQVPYPFQNYICNKLSTWTLHTILSI